MQEELKIIQQELVLLHNDSYELFEGILSLRERIGELTQDAQQGTAPDTDTTEVIYDIMDAVRREFPLDGYNYTRFHDFLRKRLCR